MPTVTLISRAFCTLGQIAARGQGFAVLPIVMLGHPIGDTDLEKVRKKGADAAEEVIRLFLASREALQEEFSHKKFSLPEHTVLRR